MRSGRAAVGITACIAAIALTAGCSSSGGRGSEDKGSGSAGGGKAVGTPRLKIAMVTHSGE
ncbi:sugar ABC transporter substrate-binding protein, partial [Streptomyces sp. NPDC094438]